MRCPSRRWPRRSAGCAIECPRSTPWSCPARWRDTWTGARAASACRPPHGPGLCTVARCGQGSLAEVPVAALVGKRVVAGTIDRLLVEPGRIRIVDFKTARRPPSGIEDVPVSVLRQLAAYAAALGAAYPGRTVEAALLYTQAPALITIPPAILDTHKQELVAMQESF